MAYFGVACSQPHHYQVKLILLPVIARDYKNFQLLNKIFKFVLSINVWGVFFPLLFMVSDSHVKHALFE